MASFLCGQPRGGAYRTALSSSPFTSTESSDSRACDRAGSLDAKITFFFSDVTFQLFPLWLRGQSKMIDRSLSDLLTFAF